MASNLTVDTLTKGSTTLNTDEIVDTSSNQICKAWVNFNGQGTVAIRDSFNVSSITDNGTGQYQFNFINAMPNLGFVVTADNSNWNTHGYTPASINYGNVTTSNYAYGSVDVDYVGISVFSN